MKANECEYCSGEIRPKKVTVNHSYEGKLVIIKDVPVGVCQECGQRYYAAATLEKLDAMAQNSDAAPERISVPVMVMNI
jgi:YgiT-type zinc finger domain-containing protein